MLGASKPRHVTIDPNANIDPRILSKAIKDTLDHILTVPLDEGSVEYWTDSIAAYADHIRLILNARRK
jgi:hypothetical protein